jgi:hypothetical protein
MHEDQLFSVGLRLTRSMSAASLPPVSIAVHRLASSAQIDPVAVAYGPNYRRLQELKSKYDPNNFFHMNQNIRPSS